MKNLNKVFAMLLVVAMMMTSVVFADFSDVANDATYAEAVNVGVALGLFTGYEDGTFQPDGNITRAEFAAMVVRALNQESQAASAATAATDFSDVPADHWAKGYINISAKKGIINGYPDGTFRPENNVTFEEAVKMLVVAIGHEPEVGTAGYPVGYLTVAADWGITTDDTKGVSGEAATRGLVAQLLLNAMDTPLMEQVGYGTWLDYQINDGYNDTARETLLSENHNIVKLRVTVKDSSLLSGSNSNDEEFVTVDILNSYSSKYTESEFTDAYGDYLTGYTILSGDTNISELVGTNAIVYARYNAKSQDDPVAVYALKDTTKTYELKVASTDRNAVTAASGTGTAMDPYTGAITFKYFKTPTDKKATAITIKADPTIYVNGGIIANANTNEVVKKLLAYYGEATFQRLNRSTTEDYDTIFVTNYETMIVDSVSTSRYRITAKNTTSLTYYDEDGTISATLVDADGNAMDWADLKENDIVSLVKYEGNTNKVIKGQLLTSTVAGTVTGASSDGTEYVIGGETYEIDGINVEADDITLGDEGTFFLDIMGNICYYDTTAEVNSNYALVVKVGTNGSNLDTKTALKMYTYDGQFGTLTTASKVKVDGIANIPSNSIRADYAVTKTAAESEKLIAKYGEDNYTVDEVDGDDIVKKVKAIASGDVITFKTNAAGEITEITRSHYEPSVSNSKGKFTQFNDSIVDLEYNEKSESFTGAASKIFVTDKTVVMVGNILASNGDPIGSIEDKTDDDFSLFSVSNIVDEQVFENAFIYNVNEDKEAGLIVVLTETESVDAAAVMALVTGKGTASDDEGNTVWNIKVLQDGLVKDGVKADALITDSDSDYNVVAYDTIVPKYNAAGEVKAVERLAYLSGGSVVFDDSALDSNPGDKVRYYYGNVSDIDRKEFTVDGTNSAASNFVVSGTTNVYVYNSLVNSKFAASIDSYDVVEFENGQAYYGTTAVNVACVAREYDEEIIDLVIYILP